VKCGKKKKKDIFLKRTGEKGKKKDEFGIGEKVEQMKNLLANPNGMKERRGKGKGRKPLCRKGKKARGGTDKDEFMGKGGGWSFPKQTKT